MSYSSELNNLIRKHITGQKSADVTAEFNNLMLRMRKSESSIERAIDRLSDTPKIDGSIFEKGSKSTFEI